MKPAIQFILLFVVISTPLFAQNTAPPTINYIVKKGETLFRLSQNNKISFAELKKLNPQLSSENIKEGDVLKIPATLNGQKKEENLVKLVSPPANAVPISVKLNAPPLLYKNNDIKNAPKAESQLINTANKSTSKDTNLVKITEPNIENNLIEIKPPQNTLTAIIPKKHIVKKGETLTQLCKQYKQEPETIKNWNGLLVESLKINDTLTVGWNIEGDTVSIGILAATPVKVATLSKYEKKFKEMTQDSLGKYTLSKGKGIATKFDDAGLSKNGDNMMVLHRSLPKNAIIKIENPMNKRSVIAKVVGKVPDLPENENIELQFTQSIARKLNILDQKTILNYFFPTLKGSQKK